jgi:hypothetical protein
MTLLELQIGKKYRCRKKCPTSNELSPGMTRLILESYTNRTFDIAALATWKEKKGSSSNLAKSHDSESLVFNHGENELCGLCATVPAVAVPNLAVTSSRNVL